MTKTLTLDAFNELVLRAVKPVVLEFGADW
ncbi:MAG: thioredoxin [Alicyclobacillus sp.]|nr:thioredoxin [Alicyclobacillus sp.]